MHEQKKSLVFEDYSAKKINMSILKKSKLKYIIKQLCNNKNVGKKIKFFYNFF